jgi:hypothetical protein
MYKHIKVLRYLLMLQTYQIILLLGHHFQDIHTPKAFCYHVSNILSIHQVLVFHSNDNDNFI